MAETETTKAEEIKADETRTESKKPDEAKPDGKRGGEAPLPPHNPSKLEEWTEEYEEPSGYRLPIEAAVVDLWLETILLERLLVIRGVDTGVFYAAEHAIAAAFLEREAGAICRRVNLRRSATNKSGAKAKASEKSGAKRKAFDDWSEEAVCTVDYLFEDRPGPGKASMLITAAAYNTRLAEPLLGSLPDDESGLDLLRSRLIRTHQYLVFLTTPKDLPLSNERSLMPSFKGEVDFIRPRLSAIDPDRTLEEKLRTQYEAGYWAKGGDKPALDNVFVQEFLVFLERGLIRWNIEALEERSKTNDKDAYDRARQQKLNRLFDRKQGWPESDQFFDQVLLFVAAFFSQVPIEDYSRIVSRLMGKNNRRTAVPVRALKRSGRETTIAEFQAVPLTDCWWDTRNSVMETWGLRVEDVEGRYCVTAPDAQEIRRVFASKYPFTYMELWRRMLDGGFLFDESSDVAAVFEKLMVDRICKDTDRFGQTFLQILASDQAVGFAAEEELDLAERFERLKEMGRQRFVLERIGALMRAILADDSHGLVAHSIEQLIELGAAGIALRLLHLIGTKLIIAKRLKLVKRILYESGEAYWEDACTLLAFWLRSEADWRETLKWISELLPAPGAEPNGQSIEIAGAVMGVVTNWFAGPAPDRHKLTDFLSSEPAEGLSTLVKWLFNPALEAARNEQPLVAFFGAWLLAAYARAGSEDEKNRLAGLQILLYRNFRDALAILAVSGGKPIEIQNVVVVREYQATVIADWIAALPESEPEAGGACRKQLMEVLAKEATEDLRRELFVVWRAMDEASAAKAIPATNQADAALLRKVTPTLQQGRKIFRQLMSGWAFPSKIAAQAV